MYRTFYEKDAFMYDEELTNTLPDMISGMFKIF